MTKRLPISAPQNNFFDTENVDDTDLTLEQNFNQTIAGGIIGNHFGNGVLPESLEQNVLFDSSTFVGLLDGKIVNSQAQPSDSNFGNQLEIELTNSTAAGKRAVKLGVIGLDFQGLLQYETFYFHTNEKQVSKKHFTRILLLMFNDLLGNPSFSMNLGGTLVIRETKGITLSRDPLMVAQNMEPSLFFRDFFFDGFSSLQTFLQTALPTYNTDSLNIFTDVLDNKRLSKNDVSTQIGQKFLATTNNIQKITLLLSIQNLDTPSDLSWNGELVLSVYPLQSTIDCPSDLAPTLPIDFSPSNIPLAQISDGYSSLLARGIFLDSVPQPVDFVLSNSQVGGGSAIVPGEYYTFSLKRSGAANKSDILIGVGGDRVSDSRITIFTGTLWVDIPEQDLWFEIYSDAAKISDGQAYDSGHGVQIEKTKIDPQTQATIDYSFGSIEFSGNDLYRVQLEAITDTSDPIPDQSTGDPVDSRRQFIPEITMLNSIDYANVIAAIEPVLIGSIADKNRKFDDSSNPISSRLYTSTIVGDEVLIKMIDDGTDPRFDSNVSLLASNLLNGDFVDAKFIPNNNNSSVFYRISEAKLCSMILGDVNGDGRIDEEDLSLLNLFMGTDLNKGLPLHSTQTTDGYYVDGYTGYATLTTGFTDLGSANFQVINKTNKNVIGPLNGATLTDGTLIANPSDPSLAQFTSSTIVFNDVIGLLEGQLVVFAAGNDADCGAFDILSLDAGSNTLTIKKILLSGDTYAAMLRADINNDGYIGQGDGYLLSSYIDKLASVPTPTPVYSAPTSNPYQKIGSSFDVIRLRVEKFIDRADDYTTLTSGRGDAIHDEPDIFTTDGYFQAGHNFLTNPSILVFQKQLTWEENLLVCNDEAREVPVIFSSTTTDESSCDQTGVNCNLYSDSAAFDPGANNFFVPNDLILGSGNLKRPDGSFFKEDLEIGVVVLEIPQTGGNEKVIDVFSDFVLHNQNGLTFKGFPAMRFADCSFVGQDALSNNQVRFAVSVQSFSPQTGGISEDGYELPGIIVDPHLGVSFDSTSGILSLNFTNLFEDPVLLTLSTKVEITVYLKKAGFNNRPLFVNSTQTGNLMS